jgi:type I restriction enzyme S subunit
MQIPSIWVLTTIGEIGDVISGGTPSTAKQEYFDGDIPWLTPADLSGYQDKYISQGKRKITKSGLVNSSAKLLPANSILFSSRAPIGYVVIARNPISTNQGFKNLVLNEGLFHEYAYYYLKSAKQLAESMASGTTFKEISGSKFAELPIPLPPLPEQHRIVAKIEELFSDLDAGIVSLHKAKEQLKTYRQSVLKWAFEGKLTEEWRKKSQPQIEKNDKSVPKNQSNHLISGISGSDNLPEGWKWVKISDICDVVRGGSPRPAGDPKYYDGKIPFLKVRDITKDNNPYLITFEYTIKEAGLHKTRKIAPNTLLLSNSGATLGVPKICMLDATMNDGIAAFLKLDQRSNLYLYYFWLNKTKELRNINMGAAQPNLNTDIIKNYLVPYCSFEEQSTIVSEIESRLSVADNLEKTIDASLAQADALRQSILKRAFEGKLVPQDPNDEPAEKLLERIKNRLNR